MNLVSMLQSLQQELPFPFLYPGAKLELHQPTVERMRESYAKRGMELNEARLRMVRPRQTC